MKKKVLIIAFLILAQIGAFYLQLQAQGYGVQNLKYPSDMDGLTGYELLADETSMTYTKTGVRIVCSNDTIHFKLYQKWQHAFTRYCWIWKKDRKGPYKLYTITVSRKDAELIKSWSKTNL